MALNGWKEIAGYVGRGTRTAQRWETRFGLPIHRPAGAARTAVFALQQELDLWMQQSPLHDGDTLDLEALKDRLQSLEAECARLQGLILSKRMAGIGANHPGRLDQNLVLSASIRTNGFLHAVQGRPLR